MVEIEEVQTLLDIYVNKINVVLQFFFNLFNFKNPSKLWRRGLVNRIGYLDEKKQIEYSFHGAGCTVEFENGEIISFDFLEDDTFTFDLFKFETFVLDKIENKESMISFFQKIELYKEGEIWKIRERSEGSVPGSVAF
jgi:hypothetical protein